MAIKGEVHVKSMIWAPKISLNDGRYVIRPFECKIIGQAELPGARPKEEKTTTNKRLHKQILVRLNVLDLQWTIL